MIGVRAIPGAGKNFIATILSKHYQSNNVMHYDEVFNEYFHSPHIIKDPFGNIKQPFWNGSNWNIITSKEVQDPIIMHEHEWVNDPTGVVKKYRIYEETNGEVGLSPNWSQNITEGFFIYCDRQEDIDFSQKLMDIKINGFRPVIVYDENTDSSTSEDSIHAKRLRVIGSLGKALNLNHMVKYAMTKMTYLEWIETWKQFCVFVKPFPYMFPFSFHNITYISDWLRDDMKWNLFDKDIFISHLESWRKTNKNNFTTQTEKDRLDEVRELDMRLYEIRYSDLFFDQKSTGSILDSYSDSIKTYTEKNIKIIQEYENFYGKMT